MLVCIDTYSRYKFPSTDVRDFVWDYCNDNQIEALEHPWEKQFQSLKHIDDLKVFNNI